MVTLEQVFASFGALAIGWMAAAIVSRLWRGEIRLRLPWETAAKPAQAGDRTILPGHMLTDDEFETVHAWAGWNPWFHIDKELNAEAKHIEIGLRRREPDLPLQRVLEEVTAEMHRRHPEIVPLKQ